MIQMNMTIYLDNANNYKGGMMLKCKKCPNLLPNSTGTGIFDFKEYYCFWCANDRIKVLESEYSRSEVKMGDLRKRYKARGKRIKDLRAKIKLQKDEIGDLRANLILLMSRIDNI